MLAAALLQVATHGALAAAAVPEPLPSVLPVPVVPTEACILGLEQQRQGHEPQPYAGMVPDRAVAAVGVASCATVSCHGGPLAGNHDVQSFAATIWAGDDPHARAYEVLHSDRSQRMARLLGIGPPHRAEQCLACHSVQDTARERRVRVGLALGRSPPSGFAIQRIGEHRGDRIASRIAEADEVPRPAHPAHAVASGW
jgi:hypothetical protein